MASGTQIYHAPPSDCFDWSAALAESVRSPAELCRLLELDPALAAEAEAAGSFSLLVPQPFLARICRGDPSDPLLLQVLPRAAETTSSTGYSLDPLGEADALNGLGLLRKYQGRSLIVATGACSVHCRFCFRRHFPYGLSRPGAIVLPSPPRCNGGAFDDTQDSSNDDCRGTLADALPKIAADRTIHEVILSGGDPLMLSDEKLAVFADLLAEIPHVRRLRVHSRMPIMIPQRVNDALLLWLRGSRLSPILVVHVNHPAEIDRSVAEAFDRLIDAGIPVLSQSVLLRGVNDRVEVLTALFERLADLRVIPYYLHQLDAVAGAAHFEVPVSTGAALMAELRARLPGYAVPRYVRETLGATHKEVLA